MWLATHAGRGKQCFQGCSGDRISVQTCLLLVRTDVRHYMVASWWHHYTLPGSLRSGSKALERRGSVALIPGPFNAMLHTGTKNAHAHATKGPSTKG